MCHVRAVSGPCHHRVRCAFRIATYRCVSGEHSYSGAHIKRETCVGTTQLPGSMRFSRARIYRFLFFKKAFTLSHRACSLLIFMRFECEGFDFKAFTPGVKACEGIEGTGIHTGNSWKSGRCGIIAPYAVNTWNFNPSHSKR